MVELTEHQQSRLDVLIDFVHEEVIAKNRSTPYITLGGYAGTGKTTITSFFRDTLFKIDEKLIVAFCAFTGKAALVLRRKLMETKTLYPEDSCSTIHRLIYMPEFAEDFLTGKKKIKGWIRKPQLDVDLIIIDEASMINQKLFEDLLSYGVPIIAIGDMFQLPPIKDSFNLMVNPDVQLTEIHRQAADSPIIQLANRVREGGTIPCGRYGPTVCKYDFRAMEMEAILENYVQGSNLIESTILVGTNNIRVSANKSIRNQLGKFNGMPEEGDKLVCLKNNYKLGIFNGTLGICTKLSDVIEENWVRFNFQVEGTEDGDILDQVEASVHLFNNPKGKIPESLGLSWQDQGDLFDFGYCLTVHKAQGSQWSRVFFFDQTYYGKPELYARWAYTAITRAETELYIFGY